MSRVRVVAGCIAAVAVVWAVAAPGAAGDKLAAPQLDGLIEHDAKFIQAALAKGAPDKKTSRQIKAAAFMVAVYADAAQKGETRDAALALLKALEDEKADLAARVKAAAALLPPRGGKAAAAAFPKVFEFESVMHQFSSERVGGFGMEKELGDLGEKDKLEANDLARLAYLGNKMAMIAHVTAQYTEDKNQGGMKTVANWQKFAADFQAASVNLGAAAAKKDVAATKTALDKVNTSCIKCHDVFR